MLRTTKAIPWWCGLIGMIRLRGICLAMIENEERPMWLWGKIATWTLRWHIARELRPYCEQNEVSREDCYAAACNRLRKHFDAAWPVQ